MKNQEQSDLKSKFAANVSFCALDPKKKNKKLVLILSEKFNALWLKSTACPGDAIGYLKQILYFCTKEGMNSWNATCVINSVPRVMCYLYRG